MHFADIHTHLLCATDDGAKTIEEMLAMVDASYADGIRLICATPHFYPDYFGDNREKAGLAYDRLCRYCEEKYPDMHLLFGNELAYCHDAVSWLKNGICSPLGDSRYVLVEFEVQSSEAFLSEAVLRIRNSGYVPIVAHVERYFNVGIGCVKSLRENGALMQINADSLMQRFAFRMKARLNRLLSDKLVDFVSTDAHGISIRPPKMSEAYEYIKGKYSDSYADSLCWGNAAQLFIKNV